MRAWGGRGCGRALVVSQVVVIGQASVAVSDRVIAAVRTGPTPAVKVWIWWMCASHGSVLLSTLTESLSFLFQLLLLLLLHLEVLVCVRV